MARVVHFEIHATDPEASRAFYGSLFGWTFRQFGTMPYWTIATGDGPGIDGGLLQRQGSGPTSGQAVNAFVCTVQVDNLEDTLARSQELGATIALPTMPIPGVGWLAYIKDPDANILGLMQPDASASM